jgi:hypothetical protein
MGGRKREREWKARGTLKNDMKERDMKGDERKENEVRKLINLSTLKS